MIEGIIAASGIGLVTGSLLGVAISRWMTAPLRTLVSSARAIRDGHLSARVTIAGSEEISELAVAFNEMAEALQHNEVLRRNLVADVAHELRTPLAVLQSNLYGILDGIYPLDKARIVRLYDQTRVINRLVNDLHELAQAEAGQLPLNKQPIRVQDLIADAEALFQPSLGDKGVTLKTIVPEGLPNIEADSERLQQVLYNLVSNALRHTPSGGMITIQVASEIDHLAISVHDTGDGIPPEHLRHIFDRFYRVERDRSRHKGGTGLGLAITRALVEAHGGVITAHSTGISGAGATFSIRIPV